LGAVASRYDELKELGVEVLSVSVDSVHSHKIWHETELSQWDPAVQFPMLSDPGGRIGSLYGVYDEKGGVNVRGRFIIDPDGVIQAMEVLTPPVGRNVDELIRQVQAYQHHRETGEVIPSGWKPGKKTLKPGPELTGKVWKEWDPRESRD